MVEDDESDIETEQLEEEENWLDLFFKIALEELTQPNKFPMPHDNYSVSTFKPARTFNINQHPKDSTTIESSAYIPTTDTSSTLSNLGTTPYTQCEVFYTNRLGHKKKVENKLLNTLRFRLHHNSAREYWAKKKNLEDNETDWLETTSLQSKK